ncbi:hypothetical protein [Helicobacter pylori]|uniref:hypothetical protein n=1 Tax=Helicobacter pylori TaxID=210 RepID=UPI0013CE3832|nr:hypothetical protein [Helicobacter pylori]
MLKSNELATIETIKQKIKLNKSRKLRNENTSESYNQILEKARTIMDKAND